jgi:tetrahydromethanopterin S-methyltransferase subunit G
MANITNKEIMSRLDCIEKRLPNGELKEMHGMIKEIKEILLDPEDGIIVRVNKNTYWRKELDADEFKALLRWKQSVTHAMWMIYSAVIGIIVKLIFF